MKKPKKYLTKKDVRKALGINCDDEGLWTVDIDDINGLLEFFWQLQLAKIQSAKLEYRKRFKEKKWEGQIQKNTKIGKMD